MLSKRRLLLTCALPYANGALHLGHLLEAIQADIWARYQRLKGNTCYYISASDAHGTPIMIKAQEQGITPEALTEKMRKAHMQSYQAFEISFDNFYTTHSNENKTITYDIYDKLKKNGDITRQVISQAYDETAGMFLPDRYIKGSCPLCKAAEQYGDNCEQCGGSYSSKDLIAAISILSGTAPITKETEHAFFNLSAYQGFLAEYLNKSDFQPTVQHKLLEWFQTELKAWDITRDHPYFGFEIPDLKEKYFYVWLDAPMGYIASFKNYCEKNGKKALFDDFWLNHHEQTEIYHVIGKDIIYFHGLFWPALLKGAGYCLPNKIIAHGFLTVNGKKMSKSRGTFINADHYVTHFSPIYLRYYFAAKLTGNVEDIDINFQDFLQRINADLIGKFINIPSRTIPFLHRYFNGHLSQSIENHPLLESCLQAESAIASAYENWQFQQVIVTSMHLADQINQYLAQEEPWKKAKVPETLSRVQEICTIALNAFKVLAIYLKPILPSLVEAIETLLRVPPLTWEAIQTPLQQHQVDVFTPLLKRIEEKEIADFLQQN